MRPTIYQDSPARARPPGRLLALLGTVGLLACREPAPAVAGPGPDAAAPGAAEAALDGKTLHFTRLQAFAPAVLAGFKGGRVQASTSQIGEVALSELERTYSEGERTAKLRIVDTSLNQGSKAPRPGPAFEDEEKVGRPLRVPGAQGYLEFEKAGGRAQANLIVADRILITVTFEKAKAPEDVEQFAGALGLDRLEALVRPPAGP